MDFEIEFDLTRDELSQDVQIDILVKVAEHMVNVCGDSSRLASLSLLAAAVVITIRNAPPGVGVSPDLKHLLLDAMQIARVITKPAPRSGF